MPKMKTRKTAAKRFTMTGTGKLRRLHQMNQHKFENKSAARKRRVEGSTDVHASDVKRIKRLLGLG